MGKQIEAMTRMKPTMPAFETDGILYSLVVFHNYYEDTRSVLGTMF